MKTTRTPKQPCPVCSTTLDITASFEGNTPRQGDVTVCIQCLTVLIFGAGMEARIPSAEEMRRIHQSEAWPEVQTIINGLVRVKLGTKSSVF
jgi:hypothetical protein